MIIGEVLERGRMHYASGMSLTEVSKLISISISNRSNNVLSNLELMTRSSHMKLHREEMKNGQCK